MSNHFDASSPIAVLDSGLGGLTVARAISDALPHERILYFGDTARLPYGSKSAATVGSFVRQMISYLQPHRPKHVVIACNTATALALPAIRASFPHLSISGVVDPGAKAAAAAAGEKPRPTIGVIATEATIRSKAYDLAIKRRRLHANLILKATPLLVSVIEEGRDEDDPLVRLALKQYLIPMVEKGLDVLVLGCTHYPILKDLIVETVGPTVRVIDSAEQCAQDVAARLRTLGILRVPNNLSDADPRSMRCFVTDDAARFRRLGSRFLGVEIDEPEFVSVDRLSKALQTHESEQVWPAGQMRVV